MELVQPDHPIAQEAYETVKAMSCEYINIVAQAYQNLKLKLAISLGEFTREHQKKALTVRNG